MGCSICLDDFDQADGDAKRATALSCGHIFHYECLRTWLFGSDANDIHRPNQKRCPLCSQPTKPENMVRLYPSDANDLDTYLSGQILYETNYVGPNAVEVASKQEHEVRYKQILNDLIDFNKAVQSYVMSAHGFRVENILKSGVQVRKLVKDLTKDLTVGADEDPNEALMIAMDSLENAASEFSSMINDLARRCRRNKQLEAQLKKEEEQVKQKLMQADAGVKAVDYKLAEARQRMDEAERRIDAAKALDAQTAVRLREIHMEDARLKAEEAALRAQSQRERIETTMKLANMKNTTELQLQNMRKQVEEAMKKCNEANKERETAHNKSCTLAKQLHQLQERFKARKASVPPGASASNASDIQAKDRRIRALEARLAAQDAQLRSVGIATPERRLARRSKPLTEDPFFDLTNSSSPTNNERDEFPATPRDGFDIASQASTSTAALVSSPTSQQKSKKRARTSLSVEPERLDDEIDEALFPMPGFVGMRLPNQPNAPGVHAHPRFSPEADTTANAGRSTSTLPAHQSPSATSTANRKSPARKTASKRKVRASNTSSSKPKANYDWLKSNTGIQLGPKHRPKAL